MINKFYAIKTGMTGKFDEKGSRIGVTVLSVPTMIVKDFRTKEKHGYDAIRFVVKSIEGKKEKIKEVRTEEKMEEGQELKVNDLVKQGDIVRISGISKGKGFAGVVKRHGFAGGPRTHGQSDRERAPGSSGSTTTPGRVFPGTRRAGHMGNELVSVKGLKVLDVDENNNQISVAGSVPGMGRSKGNLVTVFVKK